VTPARTVPAPEGDSLLKEILFRLGWSGRGGPAHVGH
jgi:hypothetical protein